MKIAFSSIKSIDYGGGIEKYTLELGSRLVKLGHEVTVYTLRNYGRPPREQAGMRLIDVPCLPLRQAEKLSASVSSVARSIFDRDLDILHMHDVVPGSLALFARLAGAGKCVLQFHGLGWKRSRWGRVGVWVHKLLERAAVSQNNAYTAVSRTQCDYFHRKYGLSVDYIPTGTDIMPAMGARELLEKGLVPHGYILFASRLVREKGAQYLIPAFRKLDTRVKLVIAGDSPDAGLARKLRSLAGDDQRVLFLGQVGGRLLAELFSNAAIYAQPSESEGLSIALLEAMSYGNACLVSDIPENLEAIGDTGWSFRNGSVESLTERLDWMLRNSDETAQARERARDRVKDRYNWDSIAAQFESLYARTLALS